MAPKYSVQSLGNKLPITFFFQLMWLTGVKSILLSFQLIPIMQISKVLLKDINKIIFFTKFENVQNILVIYVTVIMLNFFTIGNFKSLAFSANNPLKVDYQNMKAIFQQKTTNTSNS